MSCLICNELLHHMCELCNVSKPFHHHDIGCSHMMYLWTNYLCISLKHILVHLRLSSVTKAKQGPFNIHEEKPLELEKEDDIDEHGSHFMNTSSNPCSHEKSPESIGLSNITTREIFNPPKVGVGGETTSPI